MLKNVEKKKKRWREKERDGERERALGFKRPGQAHSVDPLRSTMSKSGREREGALGEGGGVAHYSYVLLWPLKTSFKIRFLKMRICHTEFFRFKNNFARYESESKSTLMSQVYET